MTNSTPQPTGRLPRVILLLVVILIAGGTAWRVFSQKGTVTATTSPLDAPFKVTGGTPEQAGRYLVLIAGCNDCHTPGFDQNPNLPQDQWLTGSSVGYKGPWGISYASNLRLTVGGMTQEGWVAAMRGRNALPPMPWNALHSMSDDDLKAVYAFIRSLGVKGEHAPDAVPPGEQPRTPYIVFEPVQPAARD